MKVVDLHPEDLIDKDARGEITADERTRLEAHLERCAACRIERELRADFGADLDDDVEGDDRLSLLLGSLPPPPQQRPTEAKRASAPEFATTTTADVPFEPAPLPAAIVPTAANDAGGPVRTSTLSAERTGIDDQDDAPLPLPAGLPRRSAFPRGFAARHRWLLVAAALLVGGIAGAAVPELRAIVSLPLDALRSPSERTPMESASAAAKHTQPATTEATAPSEVAATPSGTASPVTTLAKSAPTALVVEPPSTSAARAPSKVPTVANLAPLAPALHATSVGGGALEPSARAAPPPETAPPAAPSSAADLLEEASAARRRGDYARVVELHEKLQAQFPRSREAHVSHATVGRLRLDRGDAYGAIASFDAYLAAGGGELDESVLVGRARALERLGRHADERRAWHALLAAFPSTPWSTHAKERLERL